MGGKQGSIVTRHPAAIRPIQYRCPCMAFQQQTPTSAERGRLWRIPRRLLGGFDRVTISGQAIQFESRGGEVVASVDISRIEDITLRRSLALGGWRLVVIDSDNRAYRAYGLVRHSAEQVIAEVERLAVQKAGEIGPRLTALRARVSAHRYMRYGESRELHREIVLQVNAIGRLIERNLKDSPFRAFSRLSELVPEKEFERARTVFNRQFVQYRVPEIQGAVHTHISRSLTDEQCTAIATDEAATLVLAGAGTGKTSVIVGKVIDLVVNQKVRPHEILVLAYNRRAAGEIQNRLPAGFEDVDAVTFHSLGARIMSTAGSARPSVSKLAEDNSSLILKLQDFLEEMSADPKLSKSLADYLAYYARPYKSPWDFKTEEAYHDHVNGAELRTLNGDLVRSYEELQIANFLSLNGIEFEYEGPYEHDTRTKDKRQYQPDFYLTKEKIYIEHFALDRNGRAPRHWDWEAYEEGVAWKRKAHAAFGTSLVQTYSWQVRDGSLLSSLSGNLRRLGVEMHPVPIDELLADLGSQRYSPLATLAFQFLNHVRTSRISQRTLRERAEGFGDRARASTFLDIFERLHTRYEELLAESSEIDFHTMINDAADIATHGSWKSPYKYVLVDEFQDISAGRMQLLRALGRKDASFFLVGDDWQSIYRFAGSDVGLLRNCGDYLGYVEVCRLGQTFRYGAGIEAVSSWFVQRNPVQTKRTVQPFGDVARDDGITIIWEDDPVKGLDMALQDIDRLNNSQPGTVYALTRYGWTKQEVSQIKEHGRLRVHHSTVHAAKGGEDDYAVVLNLRSDPKYRSGFPSVGNEDPLLELVLPPRSEGERYDFAEERRLFYVAMTRARFGTFLVADRSSPSEFVEELLQEFGDRRRAGDPTALLIRQIGERTPRCPKCRSGVLVVRINSRDGSRFWGCSNFPSQGCNYTTPDPDSVIERAARLMRG